MKKIGKVMAAGAIAFGLLFAGMTPANAATSYVNKTCPYNQRAGVRVVNSANSYTGINVYSPVVGGPFRTSYGITSRSFSYLSGYREARFSVTSNSLQSVTTFCGP